MSALYMSSSKGIIRGECKALTRCGHLSARPQGIVSLCSSCFGIGRHTTSLGLALPKRLHLSGQPLRLQRQLSHRRSRTQQVVRAAIFGVGAPEALLVGVVALVVFGPKGLAQAVKSLGATLRTFSPTIKELASVTNELSSTLQEQIGLDDIRNEFRNPAPTYRPKTQESESPTGGPSSSSSDDKTGTTDKGKDVNKIADEDLEAKIAESKRLAWGGDHPVKAETKETPAENQIPPKETKAAKAAAEGQGFSTRKGKSASDLSIEELEAELKRRREASNTAK